MALLLAQPGVEPAGQFNLAPGTTILGGELGVLQTIGLTVDGFQIINVRKATTGDVPPFFLLDDGTKGYGTNYGTTVLKTSTGFTSGKDVGVRLGPQTTAGSNNVTLWNKPGLYAVTLDALADSEAVLKAAAPGLGLTVDTDGKLVLGNAATSPVATVVQYKVDESIVTTGGNVINNRKLVLIFNPFGTLA